MKFKKVINTRVVLLLVLFLFVGSVCGLIVMAMAGLPFTPDLRVARVDESVGLRADAYIGGAHGITGSDTRIFTHRTNGKVDIPAGANPSLPISITPNQHYTLTGVTVVAFATIEHQNGIPGLNNGWGTREVVTDIYTLEFFGN